MTEETKLETDIVEQEIVLDETALSSIVEGVSKSFETKFEALQKGFDEKLAALEPTVKKNIGGGQGPEGDDGGQPAFIVGGTNIEKMSKEQRFVEHCRAMVGKDYGKFMAFQQYALDAREKAGYSNEGVSAEGGYLIKLPDFESEIERILPQVGGMVNEVNFVNVQSNSVLTNVGTNNVSFSTIVAEGGVKPAFKPGFSQQSIPLNKYAAIIVATDELLQDQAVDFWQDATQQYAYAYGEKIDKMVLTDNGTVISQKGILHTPGVTLEPTSGAGSTITWDDLLNAKYAVPGVTAADGIYVMHRSTFNTLRQLKGTTGYYQIPPSFTGNDLQTPWGDRIVLTDVMPNNSSSFVGTTVGAGVVYGNFKRYSKVYQKEGGMQLEMSDQATIVDASSNTQNMWQNNMVALKAEFRATAWFKFPQSFCIIGQTPLS